MTMTSLIIILWLIGAFCFGFAFYVHRFLRTTAAGSVVGLLVFMGIWAAAAGAEMVFSDFLLKRIALGASYIGIAFVPASWTRFILEHTTHRRQNSNPYVVGFYLLSAFYVLANWINPGNLFYTSIQELAIEGRVYLMPTYGPLFKVPAALIYSALLLAVLSMWVRCLQGKVTLMHVAMTTLGAGTPLLLNAIYLLRLTVYDFTPIGFIVSALMLVLMNKSAFFSELPISRRKLFESIQAGIVLMNSRREVVDLNSAALRMLALTPGPEALRTASSYIAAWQTASGSTGYNTRFVQTFDHPERGQRYYRVSGNTLEARSGEAKGSMLLMQDETALYKAEERIRYLENYDSATGLMSRQFFTRLLAQEIELCGSMPQSGTVLCVSIINFTDYCHMYGGDFGDALRREVGLRMQRMLRKYDAISRFSEDEFYLFFRFENNAGGTDQNTLRVIDRLTSLFSTPITVGNISLTIRLRCGAAFCPQHASSADMLISMAKMAQLHTTKVGGRLYHCYEESMGMSMSRYLKLEQCLHTALSNGELFVVFHPQVDLRNNQVVGAETLMRWTSAELGHVSPAEFIEVAEETGDIREIGMWVIEQALIQTAQWEHMGFESLRVGVNVSLSQLTDPQFADEVLALVEKHRVNPHMLEIEITESMALGEEAMIFGHLPKLRRAGIRLAMDDFGMGHSSLNYIKQFDLDTLKIDRALSQDILKSSTSVAMIRTVEAMCKDLNMETVVEFVEEQAQLDLLREIGCNVVQGYVFTPPLSPDACTRYIVDHNGSPPKKEMAGADLRIS